MGYELFLKSMRFKIISKQTLLIVVLAGFALFSGALFRFIHQDFNSPGQIGQVQNGLRPRVENVTHFKNQEPPRSGLPMRLKIPIIGVDATVEHVGLTPAEAMDVPKRQGNVGWFERGPRPGESGNAVVAGHYGWKNSEPSVFDDLYKLRKGDMLYVEDDKGTTLSFVVREARRYNLDADAVEVFTSSDGESHLNLVTCEGVWDNIQKSYPYRLVIFADRETNGVEEMTVKPDVSPPLSDLPVPRRS